MATAIKILFIGLACMLLYLALRGVDWVAFFAALATMDLGWAVACLVFELAALLIRAYRWNMLLAYQAAPSLLVAFVGEAIGDIGNTFLPARAGEAMRTILVARKLDVGISFVVGTAASERVSDAVFVSLIAFLMILLVPHIPIWLVGVAAGFSLLGVAILLIISFLPVFNTSVSPALSKVPVFKPLLGRTELMLTGVWQGSQALFGHPWRAGLFLSLTLVYWFADGVAILCLARAFGTHLSLPEATLFLCALGLSSAIPSTPGYIGIYQFVAVSVLTPFGVSRVHALAIVLVYQIGMVLLQVLFGGLGWLWLEGGSKQRLNTP